MRMGILVLIALLAACGGSDGESGKTELVPVRDYQKELDERIKEVESDIAKREKAIKEEMKYLLEGDGDYVFDRHYKYRDGSSETARGSGKNSYGYLITLADFNTNGRCEASTKDEFLSIAKTVCLALELEPIGRSWINNTSVTDSNATRLCRKFKEWRDDYFKGPKTDRCDLCKSQLIGDSRRSRAAKKNAVNNCLDNHRW